MGKSKLDREMEKNEIKLKLVLIKLKRQKLGIIFFSYKMEGKCHLLIVQLKMYSVGVKWALMTIQNRLLIF